MCLIHLRPANARSPSPDPIVPSRPITRGTPSVPAPPLSPQSYTPNQSYSRPRPQSGRISTTGTHTYSPRASKTSDIRRLSIQSQEQWENMRRKEAESARDRERREYEMQQLEARQPASTTHTKTPTAPDPPSPATRRLSQNERRISFREVPPPPPPQQGKIPVFSDPSAAPRSPRTSSKTPNPTLRHGSDYSYGETPVPTSVSSLSSPRNDMGPPPHPPHPSALSSKPIANGVPHAAKEASAEQSKPQKPPHRRRESSVSVVNGRDGSVLERTASGALQTQHQAGHHRQRPSGGPRRSTGNVSVENGAYGKDPRASGRSVRERIVVVDEVRGTRRREYVRFGE